MLQTMHSNEAPQTMDLFKEIDDLSDLFFVEKNPKLNSAGEGFEELQSKYSNLHENYAKEMENSKKVEKCLVKCLKFYSKLCKKYEVQQKIIKDLEESIKEKVNSIEEAQRNEEKMRGLIEVYRNERAVYAGQTNTQLRKDKEILLDICCKLINESVRSHSVSTLSTLLLRKFRKDLDSDKIFMLKGKTVKVKDEEDFDLKPDVKNFKDEFMYKSEYEYNKMGEEKTKDPEEDNVLDLSLSQVVTENNPNVENTEEDGNETPLTETEQESGVMSSLPLLEEMPSAPQLFCSDSEEEQSQGEVAINDPAEVGERREGIEPPSETTKNCDFISNCELQTSNKSDSENHSARKNSHRSSIESMRGSIFDIPLVSPKNSRVDTDDKLDTRSEVCTQETSEELCFVNNTNKEDVDLEVEDDPCDSELVKIFREMTSVAPLSPLRPPVYNSIKKTGDKNSGLKRSSNVEVETFAKNKKPKLEEEKPKGSLLDSILSAMSLQNEEFKSKRLEIKETEGGSEETTEGSSSEVGTPKGRKTRRKKSCKLGGNSGKFCRKTSNKERQLEMDRHVTDVLKDFVSAPISSKEEADKNVRHCVSALKNNSEDVIAKCIVGIVLENIDEPVEIFERPAPPLTKTQHRLIVLLSVFRTLEWDSLKISTQILSLISAKLFPDNFFWPDDCVESATRFFTALCKAQNDPKTFWKFCMNALTEMKQRCPLLVFTALKTWPDVLHDASRLKDNKLALTLVNVILFMPQAEGLRNFNQKRKLAALRHLLVSFYQFKVEDTIEGFTKKMVEAIGREEAGAEKCIVLLSKCREPDWTVKNVVPALRSSLSEWLEGKVGDSVANSILSVIRHICPFINQAESSKEKVKDFALCASQILNSRKKNHESEVNLIEVLLLLKKYPEVRKVIREWRPQKPIADNLRSEIINASAENILRELKLNRGKETKNPSAKKKQLKKSKGKKKKGKKRKKRECEVQS